MSRVITGKITVKGDLVADAPLSVGGSGVGDQVDLDVAVDGEGTYCIPGTSLAGPMRAWLAENIESDENVKDDIVSGLFGYIDDNNGQASPLFIEDSSVESAENVIRERRHGIKIQENTGTTKEGFFYTHALLPKGTRFPLVMELDLVESKSESENASYDENTKRRVAALGRIIEALQNGEVRFGACKTRGFGKLKLENLEVGYYDFSDPKALDAWLDGDCAPESGMEIFGKFFKPEVEDKEKDKCRHEIKIGWEPASAIMVKSGKDGMDAAMLPLMSGCSGGLVPVIPGASLKGGLRAQAQKILNTLFSCNEHTDEDAPHLKLVKELFGTTQNAGRLGVQDVYCRLEKPISNENWLEEKADALERFGQKQQHVAIDRFTGGASDGALYSARPVKKSLSWDPIQLTLDLSERKAECPEKKAASSEKKVSFTEEQKNILKAFVKLLIRDLKDGYIPVGFGSRRGLGEIKVTEEVQYLDFPGDTALQSVWDSFVQSGGRFNTAQGEEQKNV